MRNCKHCGEELPTKMRGLSCVTCKNGKARYGLTKTEMFALHESQDKKCKLCCRDVELFKRYDWDAGCVDHNHKTKEVRGILCHACNTSIGYVERHIGLDKLNEYLVS